MSRKLISFFPKDYEPSTGQIEIIKKVDNAFSNNNKFCIVSAPTGTGKSFLSTTLANASNPPTQNFEELIKSYNAFKQDFSGNYQYEVECDNEPPFGCFTLTITKSLQDQYKKLFEEATILKGKSNYICEVDKQSTVDIAPCLLAPKIKENCCNNDVCPYYSARNFALTAKHSVLNYKMFLHLPSHVKKKNYIVCDEASELENELVKMFTLNIDITKLYKLGIRVYQPKSLYSVEIKDWLYNLSLLISDYTDSLIKKYNTNPNMVLGEKNKITTLKNIYWQINQCIIEWDTCEWIIDSPTKGIITVSPLTVHTLTKHIFDFADQIVLMSATIIDHKKFAKTLGIDQYEYIESESTFDSNQSPIYISNTNCINYSNKSVILPKIAKQILEICEYYKEHKGIIHTHSMDITEILQKYLKHSRFLFRSDIKTNDDILNKHFNTKEPTVLVSPSLTHGVDLKDDFARFCIIVKLPYLPLSNKRIKKLFDKDKIWYENQMLNTLVQMCGRTTRSKKDFSTTYILDGNSFKIIPKAQDKLPKCFFKRIN